MLDPTNISSIAPEPIGSYRPQTNLSSLLDSYSLDSTKKGKHKKKKLKHLKKKELWRELQVTQGRLLQQSYLLGQTQRENDLLRRMSDLAVAANRKRLNANVIETTFEVLDS